jgi:hypothetical protein
MMGLLVLAACSTRSGGERTGGRVVQRMQHIGDSLLVAYEFEVGGDLYQGTSKLAPGTIIPYDSVQVEFEVENPSQCRLVMP